MGCCKPWKRWNAKRPRSITRSSPPRPTNWPTCWRTTSCPSWGYFNDARIDQVIDLIEQGGLDKELAAIIAEIEDEQEQETSEAIYELQPEFDEAYDGVIIFCKNGQEFAQLATVLNLGKRMNRKGGIGSTHVLRATEFFNLWNLKSSSSPTNEPDAS